MKEGRKEGSVRGTAARYPLHDSPLVRDVLVKRQRVITLLQQNGGGGSRDCYVSETLMVPN
jgi:hypothetical protein